VAEQPIGTIYRPEYERSSLRQVPAGDVARRLSLSERVRAIDTVRQFTVLLVAVAVWEVYTRGFDVPEMIFPTFQDTLEALYRSIVRFDLLGQLWASIRVLLIGYAIGLSIGFALTFLAVTSRIGSDILATLTAMLNPLPAIALLPLALIWFGLGTNSVVFVLLHSIIWPVALNTHTGFMGVSDTLRMVGRNYGLGHVSYVVKILIPAALPSILAGLKLGWAFGWRTLIAAELVFGAIAETGGLGWFIFASRNELDIAAAFAGLFTVILIGFLVENVIFRNVEARTVQRWGMQA
jgi:NitT/TauT family transport system permease protein